MFNLDYENRRERGWISIEEVETEADDVDADILCLRAYESVTNKRVGKIDKAIEQLVTKLELKSTLASSKQWSIIGRRMNRRRGCVIM